MTRPGVFTAKRRAAAMAYAMAGITDPARQMEVAEADDSYTGESTGERGVRSCPDRDRPAGDVRDRQQPAGRRVGRRVGRGDDCPDSGDRQRQLPFGHDRGDRSPGCGGHEGQASPGPSGQRTTLPSCRCSRLMPDAHMPGSLPSPGHLASQTQAKHQSAGDRTGHDGQGETLGCCADMACQPWVNNLPGPRGHQNASPRDDAKVTGGQPQHPGRHQAVQVRVSCQSVPHNVSLRLSIKTGLGEQSYQLNNVLWHL